MVVALVVTRGCRVPLLPDCGRQEGRTAHAKWGGNAEQDTRWWFGLAPEVSAEDDPQRRVNGFGSTRVAFGMRRT